MGKNNGAKKTSIQVSQTIKTELDNLGNKGDTYEDIIRKILDGYYTVKGKA